MIASTQAKIGRSMKIRDMQDYPRRPAPACPAPGPGGEIFCGALAGTGLTSLSCRMLLPRPWVITAVARLEARGHHPVGAAGARGGDLAALRLVVAADDIDERRAVEIALQRGLRNQERARLEPPGRTPPARTCPAAAGLPDWGSSRAG